eukprot:GHVH01016758.1.p1 GENE.GHVH01016758.1~~GHVH01016758.1.p1  ORF type:complete len:1517 (-),score=196.43 GHVH01016758.1:41-4591(-)
MAYPWKIVYNQLQNTTGESYGTVTPSSQSRLRFQTKWACNIHRTDRKGGIFTLRSLALKDGGYCLSRGPRIGNQAIVDFTPCREATGGYTTSWSDHSDKHILTKSGLWILNAQNQLESVPNEPMSLPLCLVSGLSDSSPIDLSATLPGIEDDEKNSISSILSPSPTLFWNSPLYDSAILFKPITVELHLHTSEQTTIDKLRIEWLPSGVPGEFKLSAVDSQEKVHDIQHTRFNQDTVSNIEIELSDVQIATIRIELISPHEKLSCKLSSEHVYKCKIGIISVTIFQAPWSLMMVPCDRDSRTFNNDGDHTNDIVDKFFPRAVNAFDPMLSMKPITTSLDSLLNTISNQDVSVRQVMSESMPRCDSWLAEFQESLKQVAEPERTFLRNVSQSSSTSDGSYKDCILNLGDRFIHDTNPVQFVSTEMCSTELISHFGDGQSMKDHVNSLLKPVCLVVELEPLISNGPMYHHVWRSNEIPVSLLFPLGPSHIRSDLLCYLCALYGTSLWAHNSLDTMIDTVGRYLFNIKDENLLSTQPIALARLQVNHETLVVLGLHENASHMIVSKALQSMLRTEVTDTADSSFFIMIRFDKESMKSVVFVKSASSAGRDDAKIVFRVPCLVPGSVINVDLFPVLYEDHFDHVLERFPIHHQKGYFDDLVVLLCPRDGVAASPLDSVVDIIGLQFPLISSYDSICQVADDNAFIDPIGRVRLIVHKTQNHDPRGSAEAIHLELLDPRESASSVRNATACPLTHCVGANVLELPVTDSSWAHHRVETPESPEVEPDVDPKRLPDDELLHKMDLHSISLAQRVEDVASSATLDVQLLVNYVSDVRNNENRVIGKAKELRKQKRMMLRSLHQVQSIFDSITDLTRAKANSLLESLSFKRFQKNLTLREVSTLSMTSKGYQLNSSFINTQEETHGRTASPHASSLLDDLDCYLAHEYVFTPRPCDELWRTGALVYPGEISEEGQDKTFAHIAIQPAPHLEDKDTVTTTTAPPQRDLQLSVSEYVIGTEILQSGSMLLLNRCYLSRDDPQTVTFEIVINPESMDNRPQENDSTSGGSVALLLDWSEPPRSEGYLLEIRPPSSKRSGYFRLLRAFQSSDEQGREFSFQEVRIRGIGAMSMPPFIEMKATFLSGGILDIEYCHTKDEGGDLQVKQCAPLWENLQEGMARHAGHGRIGIVNFGMDGLQLVSIEVAPDDSRDQFDEFKLDRKYCVSKPPFPETCSFVSFQKLSGGASPKLFHITQDLPAQMGSGFKSAWRPIYPLVNPLDRSQTSGQWDYSLSHGHQSIVDHVHRTVIRFKPDDRREGRMKYSLTDGVSIKDHDVSLLVLRNHKQCYKGYVYVELLKTRRHETPSLGSGLAIGVDIGIYTRLTGSTNTYFDSIYRNNENRGWLTIGIDDLKNEVSVTLWKLKSLDKESIFGAPSSAAHKHEYTTLAKSLVPFSNKGWNSLLLNITVQGSLKVYYNVYPQDISSHDPIIDLEGVSQLLVGHQVALFSESTTPVEFDKFTMFPEKLDKYR